MRTRQRPEYEPVFAEPRATFPRTTLMRWRVRGIQGEARARAQTQNETKPLLVRILGHRRSNPELNHMR